MKSILVAADVRRLIHPAQQRTRQEGQSLITSAATLLITVVIAGCGHKEGDRDAHEIGETVHTQDAEAGVTFNPKKGLLVPPATARFIGLQVADVGERKIASASRISAQVYRAASETPFASQHPGGAPAALASGKVSPPEAAKLREGQNVSVRSREDRIPLSGQIIALKRDLEKASGQVEVLFAIADAQQTLAAGAFVSVDVPLGGETNVLSVPCSALLHTTEGECVYAVNGDYLARTAVKLGLTDGEFTEVTDGLFAGDKVVVHPVMTLWMTELHNVNGGDACCTAPAKGK